MKKQITGVTAALLTAAVFAVSASAEYYISTKQEGNTVKAEVIADGAKLPAMEFTVELPDDIETEDFSIISGSAYNEENGRFAWADINAPEDGTVMYSVTFTVENGYNGRLTITPAEGYEEDMPLALTAEIIGDEAEADENNNADEDISDDTETSDNEGVISDDVNGNKPDDNPNTGIAVSCAAAAITGSAALAAAVIGRKRKQSKNR